MNKFYYYSPGHILCADFITQSVKKNFKNSFKFLDIGSGVGLYSKYILSINNSKGIGIDLNTEACKLNSYLNQKSISKKSYEVINDDFLSHNFNDKYDLIVIWNVIEHLDENELKKILKKINLILKSNGLLIIGVPSYQKYWSIEDEVVGHKRRYNLELLKKHVCSASFKLINYCGLTFPIGNLLFSLKKKLVQISESERKDLNKTIYSGYRKVRFLTIYPFYFKFFINYYTLYPFIIFQRMFKNLKKSMIIGAIFQKDN